MNMTWITAEPTTTARDAHAIRQRLMNPPAAKKVVQTPAVQREQIVFGYRCQKPKDAHVRAWQWHVAQEGRKVHSYIRKRAEELGVTVEEIVGQRRFDRVVEARHIVMYELREQFGMSFSEIGRRIGGRDHTVAIHAYRKISDRLADGGAVKSFAFPPGQLDVIRLRTQGYSSREVEDILRISRDVRKRRIQRAMASTGAGSMVELMTMARQRGWLA